MKYRLLRQLEVWGALLLENTITGGRSVQMMCGSHGMHEHHVALSDEDVRDLDEGIFDAKKFVYDVCSERARRDVLPVASMNSDIENIGELDPSLWQ